MIKDNPDRNRFEVNLQGDLRKTAVEISNTIGWTQWITERLLEFKNKVPLSLQEAKEKQAQVQLKFNQTKSELDFFTEQVTKLEKEEIDAKKKRERLMQHLAVLPLPNIN